MERRDFLKSAIAGVAALFVGAKGAAASANLVKPVCKITEFKDYYLAFAYDSPFIERADVSERFEFIINRGVLQLRASSSINGTKFGVSDLVTEDLILEGDPFHLAELYVEAQEAAMKRKFAEVNGCKPIHMTATEVLDRRDEAYSRLVYNRMTAYHRSQAAAFERSSDEWLIEAMRKP